MFDREEGNSEGDYEDFDQPDDGEENKFYAVAVGRTTGIFRSWTDCYDSTNGHKGSVTRDSPLEKLSLIHI